MDWLLPFQLEFMQRAFLIGTLVAIPMALLSPFLVLRGWSLMGDAISHAVLPGVVLSYLAGLPLVVGAFAAGMTCATLTGYLTENSRVKEDTVMGVVFSAMFALGIVLYASIETEVHLDHILFGNILGIDRGDIWLAAIIGGAVSATIIVLRRLFALNVFDPTHGRAIGVPVTALHYAMLAMIALTVVAALSAVGLILAIALLISPAAVALLWSRRIGSVMVISVTVSVFSVWTGVYASLYLGSAPAPTIVLVLTLAFLVSFARATLTGGQTVAKSGHPMHTTDL